MSPSRASQFRSGLDAEVLEDKLLGVLAPAPELALRLLRRHFARLLPPINSSKGLLDDDLDVAAVAGRRALARELDGGDGCGGIRVELLQRTQAPVRVEELSNVRKPCARQLLRDTVNRYR